jgi:DNA-binding SARP family transcriptional activator
MSMEIAIRHEVVDGEQEPVCFRLLGGFRLTVAGQSESPGPEQSQRLLVKLLAARCMPVDNDELIRAIWDKVPGPGATSEALHHLVGVARRRLADAGFQGVLNNGRGTYRLEIPPAQVDIHVFHALTARARELSREGDRDAVVLLEQALRLRSGEPLAGLRGDWVDRYRQTLTAEIRTAEQSFYEGAIRHGEAHDQLPGLSALHRDHPDDERVTWLYMHALYRDGEQMEAVQVKQDFDRHLRDEYGMDCGNALNDLFQRILRKDAALLTPEAVSFPSGGSGARVRPPGRPFPHDGQDKRQAEPDPSSAAQDDSSSGDRAAGQWHEGSGVPAVTNIFNERVNAKHAVFGQQIIYGTPR